MEEREAVRKRLLCMGDVPAPFVRPEKTFDEFAARVKREAAV